MESKGAASVTAQQGIVERDARLLISVKLINSLKDAFLESFLEFKENANVSAILVILAFFAKLPYHVRIQAIFNAIMMVKL